MFVIVLFSQYVVMQIDISKGFTSPWLPLQNMEKGYSYKLYVTKFWISFSIFAYVNVLRRRKCYFLWLFKNDSKSTKSNIEIIFMPIVII